MYQTKQEEECRQEKKNGSYSVETSSVCLTLTLSQWKHSGAFLPLFTHTLYELLYFTSWYTNWQMDILGSVNPTPAQTHVCAFKACRLQSWEDSSSQLCGSYSDTHSGNKTADHNLHYARSLSVSFRVCGRPCALLSFQTRASHSWIVAVETRVGLLNQRLYQHAHSQDNLLKAEVFGRWEC